MAEHSRDAYEPEENRGGARIAAGTGSTASSSESPGDGTARDPLIGTVINGRYEIRSLVAQGGTGQVYIAAQLPLGRAVAVKLLRTEQAGEFKQRFLREAAMLARLQHPNVVTLYDFGRIEGEGPERYFIAMEYLAGETLAQRLRSRGKLAMRQVLPLFRQIARGLREAHDNEITHRDLKPSNLILVADADGEEIVKIVDFGIGEIGDARKSQAETIAEMTNRRSMIGTPTYMAPEQFDGVASPKSDIHALGTILFQMITGHLPFQGEKPSDLLAAKFSTETPAFRSVDPETTAPARLEALVVRMLARHPEERPTLEDVFAQLLACEEETFGNASRSMAPGGYAAASEKLPAALPLPGILAPPPSSRRQTPPSSERFVDVPTVSVEALLPSSPDVLPPPSRPTSRRWIFGIASVLVVAGIFALSTGRLGETSNATQVRSVEASVSAPRTFEMTVNSQPQGATVLEEGRVLGTTPLTISIERTSVENTARTFKLVKEGHAPVILTQGLATADVAHTVTLVDAGPNEGSAPVASPRGAPPPALRGRDGDIRLKR